MKKSLPLISFSIFLIAFDQPAKTIYKKIGQVTVYDISSTKVFLLTSGLAIDADGSPKAYNKDNSKALDYLANAGKVGNWWALATDNQKSDGNPIIQSSSDPAPGYYISMTALQDNTKKYADQSRYVNSETIPFIVIPPKFSKDFKLGDIALVINKKNNNRCYAIVADRGPKNKIGEGSIYLCEQLGGNSNPKKGGISSDIVYILIKNSGIGQVLSKEKIEEVGKSSLSEANITEILK